MTDPLRTVRTSRLLAWASALLMTTTLAGCDLAPHYEVPLTKVPVTFREAAYFQTAAPADQVQRDAWWELFGDPILNDLESQVDAANPDLATAFAAYQRAKAFAAQARSGSYPQLNLGGFATTNQQSQQRPLRGSSQPNEYLNNAITGQVHYEIDLWDRVENSIKTGRRAAQASAADLESVRLSLHAELASLYVSLRGLDAQAEVLENAVRAYEKALQLTKSRFAGNISAGMDVSRAETQLEAARATLTDIAARRALEEHAIATLVGKMPADLVIPPGAWQLKIPEISPGLPSTLLERRPDVASAERQMAAANSAIGVARAAFFPTISIDGLLGFQSTHFNLLSLPNDFWAIGPGFILPLLDGGLRDATEAAAVAQYQLALGRYRSTVLSAFQEVEDNLSQIRLLAQEAQQVDAAVASAQRTVAMTTSLYKDGAINFLEVVVAQTAELLSERDAASIRTRRLAASVGLVRAIGGGWDRKSLPDKKAIDQLDSKT
jgi:NodT family efflux transporter outer membrane factor (OMF) lipoprotein